MSPDRLFVLAWYLKKISYTGIANPKDRKVGMSLSAESGRRKK